jgi:hypothetical protein
MPARPELYHLSYNPQPYFALVIFQIGPYVFVRGHPETRSSYLCLPVVGITGRNHHAQHLANYFA